MSRGDSQKLFELQARYIDYNGSTFHYTECRPYVPCFFLLLTDRKIFFFKDLRKVRSLAAQRLENKSELKERLKARGGEFVKLKGTHYLEYHDSMIQNKSFGIDRKILRFWVCVQSIPNLYMRQRAVPWLTTPPIRR